MTSTFRRAFVYVYNVYAGELCETDEGYSFSYHDDSFIPKDMKESLKELINARVSVLKQ